jgi:glycosyltransferase involved in cell wall biosynthesis
VKVSVIVPTFNQVKYLPTTLDHIVNQQYEPIEIILVNDGSTDGTDKVIADYLESMKSEEVSYVADVELDGDDFNIIRKSQKRFTAREIKVIRNTENMGATRSYNIGLRSASGEFVTFIPSDDIPHPEMISTLLYVLDVSGCDFAYSDMYIVNDAGRIQRTFRLPDFSFENSLAKWYFLGVSKLYRRSLHEKFGYHDEHFKLANDYELYLRFAMGGAKFIHVPRVLYSVRFHGEDRKVALHSPDNERLLYEESAWLAKQAREFQSQRNQQHVQTVRV